MVRHHGTEDNTLGQTIVKPTALAPVANTDTKLLIYGLFQKGRVLAQDGVQRREFGRGSLGLALECRRAQIGRRGESDLLWMVCGDFDRLGRVEGWRGTP